ncbi:hypothetical protein KCP75_17185 [Salmonella enterica subsp. enterica]|nr:hypothetical protein KCP75_17185 [Salmonella enterica subsp. enterica]
MRKAAYRSVSLLHKTRFGRFLGGRMNDCRRYTQRSGLSVSSRYLRRPLRRFLLQGGRMNDCPRRYVKAAYRSVSPLPQNNFGEGFVPSQSSEEV